MAGRKKKRRNNIKINNMEGWFFLLVRDLEEGRGGGREGEGGKGRGGEEGRGGMGIVRRV